MSHITRYPFFRKNTPNGPKAFGIELVAGDGLALA
jgi:hypothetical protein